MKRLTIQAAFISLFMLFSSVVFAQENAMEYMNKINTAQGNISQDFFNYMSAVFHGKSARKVEKKRKELISDITKARNTVGRMSPYNKTDTALKGATHRYLSMMLDILNNDYSKIVDMEEIAEQSYDNMEAYMMAQDKADEKLKIAGNEVELAYNTFASKNNITLLENKDKVTKKLAVVGKVNTYYHELYLIFFKSYKQEAYLMKAINEKNVSAIEQNRNTLAADAEEGLQKLSSIKDFEGDYSMLNAAKKTLEFYKKEANESIPTIIDFYVKSENMEKMQKVMNGKSNRSKEDTDNYNTSVNEYNAAVKVYNKSNNELNNNRAKAIDNWNDTVNKFLDRHTPR